MSMDVSRTSVLLLENETIIAMDVEDILREAAFPEIVTIHSSKAAEAWLVDHTPTVAIIDPHLTDGVCVDVAQILSERGVPFVIFSGVPAQLASTEPVFEKGEWLPEPSTPEAIVVALTAGLNPLLRPIPLS
jgi:DNA-binding response OmpR family regulator